jgi:hypothetical protein
MGKHLTYEQRCQLHALYRQSMTQEAIAAKIGSNQFAASTGINFLTGALVAGIGVASRWQSEWMWACPCNLSL